MKFTLPPSNHVYMSQMHADHDLISSPATAPIGDNHSIPAMRTRFIHAAALFLIIVPSLGLAGCGGTASSQKSDPGAGNGGGGGGGTGGQNTPCNGITPGPVASLNGFLPFPTGNPWNQDISSAAVDPNSTAMIHFIGSSIGLHPDFGSGQYQGSTLGIPYVVVTGSQAPEGIHFTAYGDESDPGPMPVPSNAPIEGYPNPGAGDRHVLVVDNRNCFLYELDSSYPNGDGSWNADSAAVWDLQNGEQRPWTWTSADAAGLPIFPGLIRYDEVAAGKIQHAIRFTLQHSRAAMVPPASHWAANSTDALAAPMGMRLRLKADYDISAFSANDQVILTALKRYGMIMADNGSSMFLSGTPDERWDNDDLHQLSQVQASDFEVVQMNPVYTASNLPQGSAPDIGSFTASPASSSAGSNVTLSWQATGGSYFIVAPGVGALREDSVTVAPTQTTTYTLYVTNQYGRSTATVTVTVP